MGRELQPFRHTRLWLFLITSHRHRVGCRQSSFPPVQEDAWASWNLWWISQSVSLYFCSPGFVSRTWSSSSTVYPRSHSILPWLMIYVRERSTAATEANQRKFLPVRAEKVHDGFSCPHFQLCLEVWFPGAVMSAVSACSTGLEKELNHIGRVFGWVAQRNSAQE